MEKVRNVIEEVIDVLNHGKQMTNTLNQLDELSQNELKILNDALSVLTTKTKDEYIEGRLLMLKNQITMEIMRKTQKEIICSY